MPTYPAGLGLTRFELDTSRHGYLVRICRKGKKISEFFSDSQHGGKRNAKKAAQKRYAELCELLGPANTRPTKNLMTHRNSSGKVGVHIAHSVDSRWANCEYTAYCASWISEEGKRQKISFSWNKYGKEAAFELACIARRLQSTDREAVVKSYERQKARSKTSTKRSPKTKKRK